jgi:hypothetical protein
MRPFRFRIRLDAASFFNVFAGAFGGRSYRFFSAALGVLRRAVWAAGVGLDALVGSADFAASRRTARLFQPSAIAIKRQACARHRARSALSLIGLRRPPRASQWLWPVSRTVMIDANWRCFEPRSRFVSSRPLPTNVAGGACASLHRSRARYACWRLRQLCSRLHFQAPSKVGMASIFSPSSCSARSRS